MKHYTYYPKGVCARQIDYDLDDDGSIHDLKFTGGCNGNLKGIMSLLNGMKAEDAIERMEGITCGNKPTSCPDQIAKCIREAISTQ